MTACDQCRENLPLYAVGALTSDEANELKRHLAECPACREELSGLSEAAAQIAMAVEPTVPPARLREKLLARLGDERSEKRAAIEGRHPVGRGRAGRAWFWVPAFATVVLAIAPAKQPRTHGKAGSECWSRATGARTD
jgi:anti-sigma factor RsiW